MSAHSVSNISNCINFLGCYLVEAGWVWRLNYFRACVHFIFILNRYLLWFQICYVFSKKCSKRKKKDTRQRSVWIGGPAGSRSELLCSVSSGVWQMRTGTLVVRAQSEPQDRKSRRRRQGSVPEKIISLSLPLSTLTIPCSLLPLYKIGLWGMWVAGDRGREAAYHVFGPGWPREEPSGSFAENQGMWEGRCSQNESSEAVSGQPESEQKRAPEMLIWLIHSPPPLAILAILYPILNWKAVGLLHTASPRAWRER